MFESKVRSRKRNEKRTQMLSLALSRSKGKGGEFEKWDSWLAKVAAAPLTFYKRYKKAICFFFCTHKNHKDKYSIHVKTMALLLPLLLQIWIKNSRRNDWRNDRWIESHEPPTNPTTITTRDCVFTAYSSAAICTLSFLNSSRAVTPLVC